MLQNCTAKHESTFACLLLDVGRKRWAAPEELTCGDASKANMLWHTFAACLLTPHTLHLPLHTPQLTSIFSSVKELYSQAKTPCVSSHAPKSSSAWAPALPCASQEGGPGQALPQSLLQVAARRRLALTPGSTSPGWKGEDHSRFSCGCQSLDTCRAQCS